MIESEALPIKTIGRFYGMNGDILAKLYKHQLSGFRDWEGLSVSKKRRVAYVAFPHNCGRDLSIDETSLTKGEVFTLVTNKAGKGKSGTLIALINSVKSREIIADLEEAIPKSKRQRVKEITSDLSSAMMEAAHTSFPFAKLTNDRFHVQQLVNEVMDEVRIKLRREARDEENKEHELCIEEKATYKPSHLNNGETLLQALARCKHTFLIPRSKWTSDQELRAEIIFDRYNGLRETYKLINDFRTLYNRGMTPDKARKRLLEWCQQALILSKKQFATVVSTIKNNLFTIASYFRNRATNASAESFNAKVKLFRTQLRGVSDTSFFIFRLTKLFA